MNTFEMKIGGAFTYRNDLGNEVLRSIETELTEIAAKGDLASVQLQTVNLGDDSYVTLYGVYAASGTEAAEYTANGGLWVYDNPSALLEDISRTLASLEALAEAGVTIERNDLGYSLKHGDVECAVIEGNALKGYTLLRFINYYNVDEVATISEDIVDLLERFYTVSMSAATSIVIGHTRANGMPDELIWAETLVNAEDEDF
jgi:hypothetical protein